eukprot:s3309_g6.t1
MLPTDVALWKTHDLASPENILSREEVQAFERDRVHLFCEKQRAGAFNGRRLGEDATAAGSSGILRVCSVESNPLVERYSCDAFGGLRRVLHLAPGSPVMLISNIRTIWNLVNGLRGRVVGVVWEEGSVSSDGPTSAGHPTYVCSGPQQIRHERMPALCRMQFPIVLSYGMTVHKSQGLTLKEGCVFDMEHEPTWQPFRSICGLAFVGMSRIIYFLYIAFRHVPDYWVFRAVAEAPLFQWRSSLEKQLDDKHDATSKRQFFGKASLQDEYERHVVWSESTTGCPMTDENKAALMQMLAVRGVLAAPAYTDKPQRLPASKLGGGRNKRRTMRGSAVGVQSTTAAEPMQEEENYYDEGVSDEEERMERIRQEKLEAAALAELYEEEAAQLQSTWGPTPGELQAMREDEEDEYFDSGW